MTHPFFQMFMTYKNHQVNLMMALKRWVIDWAYHWKMQFNPDPNKKANEVIFCRKTSSNNLSHPPIKFNNIDISKCPHQKNLGVVLDSKLNFNAHVDQTMNN